MRFGLFKILPANYSVQIIYFIYVMYKQDFTLNNQQELICDKTQPSN